MGPPNETFHGDLHTLVRDSCLESFKHKLPIMFEHNAADWFLNGLQILTFTCGILESLWTGLQVVTKHCLITSFWETLLALVK